MLAGQRSQRGRLAELIAIQVLRSPGWRKFHGASIPRARASIQGDHPLAKEHHFEAVEAHLRTDEQRHGRLLWQSPLLATIIANMHWTLLATSRPRLVTSDHPVVAIALGDAPTSNPQVIPPGGLFNTLEFRLAVRPDLLLLMSWHDTSEERMPRRMANHHIRNHNSLVIAQADRQWFHHPAIAPNYQRGAWAAISTELHAGYSADAALRSTRRAEVQKLIAVPIESGKASKKIPIFDWPVSDAA